MNYTVEQAWELVLLALCAWREARDQGRDGMLAVCWAVRNRVMKSGKTWWGDDWEEVMLKRWQFTSFEKSDPNASILPGDPKTDVAWAGALWAAEQAYAGVMNPIGGATHYYNPSVITAPAWVVGATFIKRIGKHSFYEAK